MESDTISDTITVSDYFGGCPHCGANHGYMNVRAEHWIVCDAHKVKWRIGSNLFSCWKDENESVWLLNAERLLGYSKVEPLPEGTWSSDATVREWQLASVRFKFDGGCLPCPATAMRRKSRTDPCDRPSTPHRSHCRPWQGLALRQRRQTRPPAQ